MVPRLELEGACGRIINLVLANAPQAIAETKALALRAAWERAESAFGELIESHAAKRQSAEAAEGLASFAEKRAARWT